MIFVIYIFIHIQKSPSWSHVLSVFDFILGVNVLLILWQMILQEIGHELDAALHGENLVALGLLLLFQRFFWQKRSHNVTIFKEPVFTTNYYEIQNIFFAICLSENQLRREGRWCSRVLPHELNDNCAKIQWTSVDGIKPLIWTYKWRVP